MQQFGHQMDDKVNLVFCSRILAPDPPLRWGIPRRYEPNPPLHSGRNPSRAYRMREETNLSVWIRWLATQQVNRCLKYSLTNVKRIAGISEAHGRILLFLYDKKTKKRRFYWLTEQKPMIYLANQHWGTHRQHEARKNEWKPSHARWFRGPNSFWLKGPYQILNVEKVTVIWHFHRAKTTMSPRQINFAAHM